MMGKLCHRRWQTVALPEKDGSISLQPNSATASTGSLESRNKLMDKGALISYCIGLRRQLPYSTQSARTGGLNLKGELRCYLQEHIR